MAVSPKVYPYGQLHVQNGDVDLDAAAIKGALVSSSYTPSTSHEFFSTSVSANEISGTGYTAGGQTLANKTVTLELADSFATTWAASTAYAVGDVVRPTAGNGHLYKCVVAGTSAAAEPTWPTIANDQISDNTVTWIEAGVGFVKWDADDLVWPGATFTSRYLVLYVDGTPGSGDYLLCYNDFGTDESPSNAQFSVVFDSTGITRTFVGA